MSGFPGRIPPIDPAEDAARRASVRRRGNEWLLFVGLVFAQVGLAALLGGWAASDWVDPRGQLQGLAALGLVLVLVGAHAVGYGALLVTGGIALITMLPRLFSRTSPPNPGPPEPARANAPGTFMLALLVALHGAVVMAGALLLCVLMAVGSDAADVGAWWRFALAALLLSPVTARLLLAWVRSEAGDSMPRRSTAG